jgi:hypothetical protein
VPQTNLPIPYTFAGLLGLLSPASVVNIRSLPVATALIADINANNTQAIGIWAQALLAPPALITTAEAEAIGAMLTATQPDPSWQSQLSWAAVNLGRSVDVADIDAARSS